MAAAHGACAQQLGGGTVDTALRSGQLGGEGPAERRRRTGCTGTNAATFDDRWDNAEERDRRRLRDELRRKCIPVPFELLEPGDRGSMEVGKGSAGVGGGDGGGGRVVGMGVGTGKGGGRADGQRTLLRTWRCRDKECGGWSWPCRGACHRCGAPKPTNPLRREDWWVTSRIPPWAGEEAPAGGMAADSRRMDGQPRSRVPGMPVKGGRKEVYG